jgi:hypothetical protein
MVGAILIGIVFIVMGIVGFRRRRQDAKARETQLSRLPFLPGRDYRFQLIDQTVVSVLSVMFGGLCILVGVLVGLDVL